MLRHEPFTNSDKVSPAVKALIYPTGSWTGYFGMPTTIRYSFLAADDVKEAAFLTSHLPDNGNKTIGIGILDARSIRIMEATLRLWESLANVLFIRDENISQLPIYTFTENSITKPIFVPGYGEVKSIAGFASYPTAFKSTGISRYPTNRGIGINVAELQHADSVLTALFLHESGHGGICLQHPFAGPFALVNANEKTTSYSIMNYDNEQTRDARAITPITPLPADVEAA